MRARLLPATNCQGEDRATAILLDWNISNCSSSAMNLSDLTERSQDVASYLKVLANSSRLLILCELNAGERSVGALEEAVGLTQSALSQHLAKLRASGIVATRRDAQTIYYRLADPKAVRVMGTLYDVFCAPGPPRTTRAKPAR